MKEYTIEFLKSIEGQIMIAELIQTWGDKDKEKAKQNYIKSLKDKLLTNHPTPNK